MPAVEGAERGFWDEHWTKVPRFEDPPTIAALKCAQVMKEHGLKRVLDLGCGQGRDAVFLAAQGLEVTGADISPVALDKARSIAESKGVRVRWVCDDLFNTAFPEAAFDAVCAVHFIHLFRRAERAEACRRIMRLLAPGGYVVLIGISTSDRYFDEFAPADEEDSRLHGDDRRLVHFFAPGSLASLLREAGFEMVSCDEVVMEEDQGDGPHTHRVWLAVARKPDGKPSTEGGFAIGEGPLDDRRQGG